MTTTRFVPTYPKLEAAKKALYAHHEAAHAVVGAAYGFSVREISIDHSPPQTVLEWRNGPMTGPAIRARVRFALAGPAMSASRGEASGAGGDAILALGDVMRATGADEMAPGLMLEELFAVQRILKTPTIQGAVEALAQALLAKPNMTEAELNVYLDPIRGRLGEAE